MITQQYFNAVVQVACAFIQAGEREPEEIIPLSIKVVNAINDQINEGKKAKTELPEKFESIYSKNSTAAEAE